MTSRRKVISRASHLYLIDISEAHSLRVLHDLPQPLAALSFGFIGHIRITESVPIPLKTNTPVNVYTELQPFVERHVQQ